MMIGVAICSIFMLTYIFYKDTYDSNEEVDEKGEEEVI